jgi:PAS domain S-box-containing protein
MTKPSLPEELVARVRTMVTGRLLERRTREIEALSRIGQASLAGASTDELLRCIVEVVADAANAELASVLLIDAAGTTLRARAAVGVEGDLDGLSMPIGEGVGGLALRTRQPVLIADRAAADPRVTNPVLRRGRFRSVMAVPLAGAAAPIGVLQIARRTRPLDARAERLLRIIGDRAAVTIERARLEAEARELADVVRRVGEGVVVADDGDCIVFANRAFAEMVGAPDESLAGRTWTEFLSTAQDISMLTSQLRQPSFQGEFLLITRSGEPRPVHLTLSALEGRPEGFRRIGVFRDISREHELRFRVIREQKFRTLGSLAAGVAHNINNRLTPVLGWTEMLLERLNAGEAIEHAEWVHALRVIQQGAADSVGTVRRLQEYSRPSRVRGPEAVQLREVVEQLLALTRPQWDNEAARRGVRFGIDLRVEPAPPILAVASEIREALLNILENALAAMPGGGRLTIAVGGDAETARVGVTDTGRGMSPEVQRLVFEPFFTTRSAEGGTGLGLALAQEIVNRYGGRIELVSQEGVGTTFTFSFPAANREASVARAVLPVLSPVRVLAVEDEPEVLDLVRAMLAHAGHTVFTAASGREALALFERETVDLVITDLGMPGMTGLVLAGELKQRRPVPVLLLTGWADDLSPSSAPHVDVILAKPFTRDGLFEAMARCVPDRIRSA